jgi:hypothetical protein
MGMSYGWWTRRVVLPPAQGWDKQIRLPQGTSVARAWVGQWVDVCCSLSTHGRPTIRAVLTAALSHEHGMGMRKGVSV